ncbi:hypothetical protein CO173_00995 [Candidatus Uhrbacteria bacterium CG_4_9_14_3_um_filter_41_35]|uniref:AAA family ATPase n=1 Tax=Candidatus Uhrbacteria bacterium CG_4_9_14_3_um_filter_41_35 TaxID=1975034 RepID=A0A2M7XGG5_9BACT|nr:MAG: hypothetical protein COV92_03680 [Candidatus Uhrbacteria bacterium CG11_big_fil_rev_8_21_14_0_20_41_9]PJA46949.1 MAG: hypothetical protein CO173_00995 [Candidatus Uhrbacteria bacterium CG_4_9_14_3_um_filter_41_35]
MKLIILNGPCGVGKSTLAKALHTEMPLSFLVDIDVINGFIADHEDDIDKEERWKISKEVSKAILKTMLELGRDVIVDKMIYDDTLLNEYREIAESFSSEVFEIILWAEKAVVMARASERGFLKSGRLTAESCELFWHKIDELKALRQEVEIIDSTWLTSEEVLKKVKNVLGKNSSEN